MSDMVQVPRERLRIWHTWASYFGKEYNEPLLLVLAKQTDAALNANLSTKAPNVDTSAQHVDDVDTSPTMFPDRSKELATEGFVIHMLGVWIREAMDEHERDKHKEAPVTNAEVAGLIELAMYDHERDEDVALANMGMADYAKGLANEDGKAPTYPEDSVNDPGCIEASPENVTHGWARGMLDLRGSVDPREGMADLHGTTTADDLCLFTADQIEAAGFVRKEDMDKAIAALRAELMPEIRRAQYPKVTYTTTQDDGDAE